MRYLTIGVFFLAAAAGSAQGQGSVWGAFEDGEGKGVGVQAADGSQLMLKCDKPGPGEVYAVVATPVSLVPPAQSFEMRPVTVQYDQRAPYQDRWRFYEHAAIAINKGAERSLTRLLLDLDEAGTLEVRLDPEPRKRPPITVKFDVAGAKLALEQVYQSCNDTVPTG